MRVTNFIEERATAMLKRSGRPAVEGDMDLAYRVLLSDDWRDWAALVKGKSMGFGVGFSKEEKWFVDGDWTLDERNGWSRRSGTDWPEKSRYRRVDEDELGTVRVVGRGSAYIAAVKEQLGQLTKACQATEETEKVVALILEGAEANSRVRRERSSRISRTTGRKYGGVELQQEVVLVARSASEGRMPLASWKIGLRAFFPVVTAEALDSVLLLNVDVLDYRGVQLDSDPDLRNQFAKSMLKLSIEALCELGPALVSPVWDEDGDPPGDFLFGLSVGLQPGMAGVEAQVHELLCGLKYDDQSGDSPLMDMHAELAWVEVNTLDRSAGEAKRESDEQKRQRVEEARAKKDALEPGDVFKLVEFDVKELSIDQSGLYWWQRWMLERDFLEKEFGVDAKRLLAECGIDLAEYLQMPFKEREKLAKAAAASWPGEGVSEREIQLAAMLAEAGKMKAAKGLVVRVLIDMATGAQCVDLVSGKESITAFRDRHTVQRTGEPMDFERPVTWARTEWDALAEGPLTLWQRPKGLLAARTLTAKHPSIEKWCDKHGVNLVRGTSGADSGSTEARLGREDVASAADPNERPENREDKVRQKHGHRLEEIRGRLKSICWALNELKAAANSGTGSRCVYPAFVSRKGADVDAWCAWRRRMASC